MNGQDTDGHWNTAEEELKTRGETCLKINLKRRMDERTPYNLGFPLQDVPI